MGLGSNEGDRLGNLRAAADLLAATDGIEIVGHSSVYETEPVGEVTEQRDFYNAALKVETRLEPRELLAACKRIEEELGREPGGPRHGPRPLDLDLLLVGGLELAEDGLTVPHPEIAARRFALTPLLELDPELRLPGGRALAEVLDSLGPGQRVDRVGRWS